MEFPLVELGSLSAQATTVNVARKGSTQNQNGNWESVAQTLLSVSPSI